MFEKCNVYKTCVPIVMHLSMLYRLLRPSRVGKETLGVVGSSLLLRLQLGVLQREEAFQRLLWNPLNIHTSGTRRSNVHSLQSITMILTVIDIFVELQVFGLSCIIE